MRRFTGVSIALVLAAAPTSEAQEVGRAFEGLRPIEVMVLGTFHFDDPGLDDYQPQFPWDPTTPEHQAEIEDLVDRLARFRPTMIAVEWSATRQARLDSIYGAYVAGRAAPGSSEVQQVGFRMARHLGHERIHAVDAQGRSFFPDMTDEAYEVRVAELLEGVDPARIRAEQDLEAAYQRLHRESDSLKTVLPLATYLARENEPARILRDHGQYLIGGFELGDGEDYLGPDLRTRWFNRNLRIFNNLQRLSHSSEDRLLLIIGAGHLALIRHAIEASPEYRLVEPTAYLLDRPRR